MPNQEPQLSNIDTMLMTGTALFFDLLQWLLNFVALHWVVTIFAYMTFFLWFYMKGIKIFTPKKLAVATGGFVVEAIPIISALPTITAMVVATIINTKGQKILSSAENTLTK